MSPWGSWQEAGLQMLFVHSFILERATERLLGYKQYTFWLSGDRSAKCLPWWTERTRAALGGRGAKKETKNMLRSPGTEQGRLS